MEKNCKRYYEAPSTMVFEVKQQGVICASGEVEFDEFGNPVFNGLGDEEEM